MHLSKRTEGYLDDMYQCIWNGHLKGTLNAVLGCTKAFSTSLPIASARRSLLNTSEPNFFASGFSKLSGEEEGFRRCLAVGGTSRRFAVVEKLFAVNLRLEKQKCSRTTQPDS